MKEAFVSCQGVLAGEMSSGPLMGGTGNYCSHIMLVFEENQGPWGMNHECVAHIWLTASE